MSLVPVLKPRNILEGKNSSDIFPFKERLDLRNIPEIRFDRLELGLVGHTKIGRFDNIGGDEFDMGLDLQEQLSELLADETCVK